MENNLLSLNRVFLNISNPADKRGLVINQGDILRGVVRDIDANGLVRVLIQGHLIEALAEARVESGQNLHFLVEDVRPGRVTLKVLTPEALNRVEQSNLASQLKDLGITPSEGNIRLARALLENQLPVNRVTMGQVAQVIQHLGSNTTENSRLAALAVKYNTPVNPQLLESLASFFNSKPDLANLYQQLSQILARSQPESALKITGTTLEGVNYTAASTADTQAAGTRAAAENSPFGRILPSPVAAEESLPRGQAAAGLNLPENPTAGSAQRMSSGVINSSLPPAAGETANQVTLGPSSLPTGNTDIIGKLWPLLQAILDNMAVEGDSTTKPIQTQLQQIIQTRPDLLQGLLLSERVLETSLPENHPLRELAAVIKSMEGELSGQQIVNTIGRLAPDTSFPGLYLTFPFKMDNNQYTMCELRLHRDPQQSRRSSDSIQIAVSLDTSRMGLVVFHAAWKRSGILDIQAVVENDSVRNFFQKHWSELRAGLEQYGYQVNNLGIRVVDVRTAAESLRPALQSAAVPNIRPISIDITI